MKRSILLERVCDEHTLFFLITKKIFIFWRVGSFLFPRKMGIWAKIVAGSFGVKLDWRTASRRKFLGGSRRPEKIYSQRKLKIEKKTTAQDRKKNGGDDVTTRGTRVEKEADAKYSIAHVTKRVELLALLATILQKTGIRSSVVM